MRSGEIWLTAPGAVEFVSTPVPEPGSGQILVRSQVSGISPGTELLTYRGTLPESSEGDDAIDPYDGGSGYPRRTGYCVVGKVAGIGDGVDRSWSGRRVFAFAPHGTHAAVSPDSVIPMPDDLGDELATFIPNLETALGVVMDARPVIGERVVVFGQGIVGSLVTRLLARFPLGLLATADRLPGRRAFSLTSGADLAIDPSSSDDRNQLDSALMCKSDRHGADLVIELSGNPEALNDAIAITGYGGRVVVGSWYGSNRAQLDLGGRFHRNRIHVTSSQVSSVDPSLAGRWTKSRRKGQVLRLLPELNLEELISHRFPLESAAEAFDLLDVRPDEAMQVVLTCEEDGKGSN